MKTIIYTGIALFSVASVYGITDYYSSKKSGVFNSLYKEKDAEEMGYKALKLAPFISEKLTSLVARQNENSKAEKERALAELKKPETLKFERKIYLEDFSRGRIRADVKIEDIKSMDAVYDTAAIVPVIVDSTLKQ